ncbi:hypothetical protein AK812_SmicGene24634 [Symbiodinium microadriaticum]|uniref:Uncharacterized protein n=1 Tax=Symbiodinium microadriaticum TaxID=2951 RepID=A0A1Q9DEH8_SYMMI|nr:hypothetical protein AK812_SmicGene24634 [Symbiodinium microadriaticum]
MPAARSRSLDMRMGPVEKLYWTILQAERQRGCLKQKIAAKAASSPASLRRFPPSAFLLDTFVQACKSHTWDTTRRAWGLAELDLPVESTSVKSGPCIAVTRGRREEWAWSK